MTPSIDDLTTTRLADAFALRERVPALAAELSGRSVRALARELAGRTACLTMLAGSGSRWVSSLREAALAGRDTGADPAAPRGLYPVPNAMPIGPDPLPIAGYALAATRDLGRHIVVVRGWEREIEDRVLRPLGYPSGSWTFVTQEAPGGKPRGHGDAAFQAMGLWADSEYVLVNFGGDASSPLSALAALIAMDALSRALGDGAPGLLLPAAFVPAPAYPISLGEDGLPAGFGHAKLQGSAPGSRPAGAGGYTNVGVRVYRTGALREAILGLRRDHWTERGGYALPGNAPSGDPAGGEFALDNVDALLAASGRARLLAVSRPEELSPVKSLEDLPRFTRDAAAVCRDWAALGRLLE